MRLDRERRPAVVIADIVLPEKYEIETVRELLAIDPAAIIFTISGCDERYQEVARMAGGEEGVQEACIG